MSQVVWFACACRCWPMAIAAGASTCGECGQFAETPCAVPENGMAYRI
jgi:hypothetical protein